MTNGFLNSSSISRHQVQYCGAGCAPHHSARRCTVAVCATFPKPDGEILFLSLVFLVNAIMSFQTAEQRGAAVRSGRRRWQVQLRVHAWASSSFKRGGLSSPSGNNARKSSIYELISTKLIIQWIWYKSVIKQLPCLIQIPRPDHVMVQFDHGREVFQFFYLFWVLERLQSSPPGVRARRCGRGRSGARRRSGARWGAGRICWRFCPSAAGRGVPGFLDRHQYLLSEIAFNAS